MKFNIKTKLVKEYIRKMSSLVPNSAALPHESGILITVEETRIIFRARNEYVALKIETNDIHDFNIEQTGQILVKGRMLNEIISKMHGDTISFTKIDSKILFIKSDDSEYEINLLNEENYQIFDINITAEEGTSFTGKGSKFKSGLAKVTPAVPENHQRKILQGINVEAKEGKVFFTATNGTRIHRTIYDAPQPNIEFNKTINIKAVKEIQKILSDNKETIFKFTDKHLIILDKELSIKTRLIDGVYPELTKLYTIQYNKELTIPKETIIELFERTSMMNPNAEKGIVKMIINNGELTLEAREIEIGYSNVKTTNFKFDYEQRFEISVSPKFMMEAIKSVDNKKLKIDFSESDQPIKV
jgi:DNA polymerase-3 subunit beta